jgi:secreted Zn-dependent insulinase-like peptidase
MGSTQSSNLVTTLPVRLFIYLTNRFRPCCCRPNLLRTPRSIATLELLIALFEDSISERFYSANLASNRHDISPNNDWVEFEFRGYDEKLGDYGLAILEALKEWNVEDGRWEVGKDKLRRNYKNWQKKVPYEIARGGSVSVFQWRNKGRKMR